MMRQLIVAVLGSSLFLKSQASPVYKTVGFHNDPHGRVSIEVISPEEHHERSILQKLLGPMKRHMRRSSPHPITWNRRVQRQEKALAKAKKILCKLQTINYGNRAQFCTDLYVVNRMIRIVDPWAKEVRHRDCPKQTWFRRQIMKIKRKSYKAGKKLKKSGKKLKRQVRKVKRKAKRALKRPIKKAKYERVYKSNLGPMPVQTSLNTKNEQAMYLRMKSWLNRMSQQLNQFMTFNHRRPYKFKKGKLHHHSKLRRKNVNVGSWSRKSSPVIRHIHVVFIKPSHLKCSRLSMSDPSRMDFMNVLKSPGGPPRCRNYHSGGLRSCHWANVRAPYRSHKMKQSNLQGKRFMGRDNYPKASRRPRHRRMLVRWFSGKHLPKGYCVQIVRKRDMVTQREVPSKRITKHNRSLYGLPPRDIIGKDFY